MPRRLTDDVCDCDQWWATLQPQSLGANKQIKLFRRLFTAGSSWPTLRPFWGTECYKHLGFVPTGGLCQSQSQLQRGSLRVRVRKDSQPSITETVMAVTAQWLKREQFLDRRPEINAGLDRRPEIITWALPLCECEYHVMLAIQFRHLDTIKQWRVGRDALPVTDITISFLGEPD